MLGRFLGNHYVESGLRLLASLPSRLRYVGYHSKYDLDDGFRITKGGTRFKGDGEISIGSGSYLGRTRSSTPTTGTRSLSARTAR